MIGANQTNVVIVYTAEARTHADYLRDLIALQDDIEGVVVGIKDGTVKVTTCVDTKFDEKNNTSAQKVIYIGDCKRAESTKKHARWKIDVHGLKGGWFGNKAILYIENPLKKKKDYEDFCNYGQVMADRLTEQFKKVENSTGQKIGKALSIASLIAWIPVPFVGIPGVVNLTTQSVKRKNAIKQQQYDTLVREFYLDYLQSFIEGKA
jgi:hypothetical protein